MNGILPLRFKDIVDKFPKTIYFQIFNLSELPPFYLVHYDCKFYTSFKNNLNPDVIFYLLKR